MRQMYIYTHTEVQVQGKNLTTNKQIEVITNSELHWCQATYFILSWNTYREIYRQHIE